MQLRSERKIEQAGSPSYEFNAHNAHNALLFRGEVIVVRRCKIDIAVSEERAGRRESFPSSLRLHFVTARQDVAARRPSRGGSARCYAGGDIAARCPYLGPGCTKVMMGFPNPPQMVSRCV